MSCRCGDILVCKLDICTIGEILGHINTLNTAESDITEAYFEQSAYSNKTFIVKDMERLMRQEKELNHDMLNLIPTISTKCQNEIESLERQLTAMESEDESYHEELARKEAEEKDKGKK